MAKLFEVIEGPDGLRVFIENYKKTLSAMKTEGLKATRREFIAMLTAVDEILTERGHKPNND